MDDMAIQNRKFAKTCVEKKRRDRINKCLDELKDLMSITDDKAKFQKLEKAEILEMVVDHMRNIQETGGMATTGAASTSTTPSNLGFYYAIAYRQCLNEFQSFLAVFPDVSEEFKARIMGYMTQRYMDIVASVNNNKTTTPQPQQQLKNEAVHVKKEKKQHRYSPYGEENRKPRKSKDLSVSTNNEQQNTSAMSTASSASPSSSSYFYNQTGGNYGGSCSSLDSFQQNTQPQSPSNDSTASDMKSESPSNCSSPDSMMAAKKILLAHSDLMFTNFELYQNCLMKVWRPW
jgi:hypothetical protein